MIRRLLIRLLRLDCAREVAQLELKLGNERARRRSAEEARTRSEDQLANAMQMIGESEVRATAAERRLLELAGICWENKEAPEQAMARITEALGGEGRHRG